MNRHDQDPHDWLTAQFSDDDDLDDENAGTDAADADAVDSTAATAPETTGSASSPDAPERAAAGTAPEPALAPTEPVASEPVIAEPVISAPVVAEPVISEPVISESESMRRASTPVATTGEPFTWGLKPTAGQAAPAAQPAPETPRIEREPDPLVPAAFLPARTSGTTPTSDDTSATGSRDESPAAAAPTTAPAPAPVAAQAAAPISAVAPVSAAAASAASAASGAPAQPARPFYPPPPAISRPEPRTGQPASAPVAAAQPPVESDQADAGMSIAEVLDAPSPRRAAREAAAREEAAREASVSRDDIVPAPVGAVDPHDDGIDDLVDPHAPFTPQSSAPFLPEPAFPFAAPDVPGAADPVPAAGAARFDVPVVPTADGPALVGRAQSVAGREARAKVSSSNTQRILLIAGIVLVVVLAIVLIFVLAQRADAAALIGALDAGSHVLAAAARLTGSA